MTWFMMALTRFKGIPWQVWAAIALIAAVGLSHCHGQSVGRDKERAAWEASVEDVVEKRVEAGIEAAITDTETKAEGEAAITERRKELDNATQDLPDERPSAISRERIDRELRRP